MTKIKCPTKPSDSFGDDNSRVFAIDVKKRKLPVVGIRISGHDFCPFATSLGILANQKNVEADKVSINGLSSE
jgi:hypothetical protein